MIDFMTAIAAPANSLRDAKFGLPDTEQVINAIGLYRTSTHTAKHVGTSKYSTNLDLLCFFYVLLPSDSYSGETQLPLM